MGLELFMSEYVLIVSYILCIGSTIVAVLGPIITSLNNPKSLIKSAASLVILLVFFFISYALADNEVTPKYLAFDVNSEGSQLIGGILIMTYLLFGLTILGIVVNWVTKLFN